MKLLLYSALLLVAEGAGYAYAGHGVDASFPMHGPIPKNLPGALRYEEFINGCASTYSMSSCKANEDARISMNQKQVSRQRNYTELGFTKLKAPDSVYMPARKFWDAHKDQPVDESWPAGNTYTNHWVAPTKMVSLEDRRFQPMGQSAKQKIWDGAKPILEAWTGQKLKPTSLYGIRVYSEGAMLATHVDRLPLVTSCIIQIDQDVDEPWPVEVIGHDGRAYNVTLEPGEMALYESHTVLHGRPYPMKGRYYANAFVHFIPMDAEDPNENERGIDFHWGGQEKKEKKDPSLIQKNIERLAAFPTPVPAAESTGWAVAAANNHDEKTDGDDDKRKAAVPQRREAEELVEGSIRSGRRRTAEKKRGRPEEEEGHQEVDGEDFGEGAFATGTIAAIHTAAAMGDLPGLLAAMKKDPRSVNSEDEFFWTPLHEAARSGSLDIAKALVENGADMSARTFGGGSALWLARKFHNSAVALYLEALGAPDLGDEEL